MAAKHFYVATLTQFLMKMNGTFASVLQSLSSMATVVVKEHIYGYSTDGTRGILIAQAGYRKKTGFA